MRWKATWADKLTQTMPPTGLNSEHVEGQDKEPIKPPPPPPKPYKLPSFRLLAKPNNGSRGGDQKDYMQTARKLEKQHSRVLVFDAESA